MFDKCFCFVLVIFFTKKKMKNQFQATMEQLHKIKTKSTNLNWVLNFKHGYQTRKYFV